MMAIQSRDDYVQLLFQLELDKLENRFSFERLMKGGKGGSITCVYVDDHTKQPVVIKVLFTPTEDELRRFEFEANVLLEFRGAESLFWNRPIVGVTPVKKVPNKPIHYFVMEYADGISLHDYLRSRGFPDKKLPWEVSVEIAQRISQSLSVAVRYGVVHRDLHDRNIIITDYNPEACAGNSVNQIRIIDFGCGRVDSPVRKFADDFWFETHTLGFLINCGVLYDPRKCKPSGQGTHDSLYTRRPLGAWSVVAPEVLTTPQFATHRADVWSLGSLLYFMLTGYFPFQDESLESLLEKMRKREYRRVHEARNDLPHILSDVVELFLEPDPEKRIGNLYVGHILIDLLEIAVDFWELHPDFTFEYIKHHGNVRTCGTCYRWSFITNMCQNCGARFNTVDSHFDWTLCPFGGPERINTVKNGNNFKPKKDSPE